MKKNKLNSGLTLMELLISMAIFSLMLVMIATFAKNIFSYKRGFTNTLSVYDNARTILQPIASEIRSASVSSLGSYPVETAADNTFTFYADTNNDGLKERNRYFLSGTTLKKGVTQPTGNPLSYSGAETTTDIVYNVTNTGGTPIFSYYDTNYTGSSAALTQPVNISDIRLIKINLLLDADVNNPPTAVAVTTQISLRNLKDNQ